MDPSEYLGLFLDESRESLQALNASLLRLERDPSGREPLAVIFRAAHSLKGMSATMGFAAMARLTHRMEEVLAAMRDDGAPVTPAVTDALFACLDTLQEMVDRVAAGVGEEVDAGAVLARLDAVASGAPAAAAGGGRHGDGRIVVAGAHERAPAVLRVDVTFADGCRLPAARAVMVARELEAVGDLIGTEPPADRIASGEAGGAVTLWIAVGGDVDPDDVRARALVVSEVAAAVVSPVAPAAVAAAEAGARVAAAAPPAPAAGHAPPPARAAGAGEARPAGRVPTVRVGTDRLDALMDLMGEMLIQRTRLARSAARHDLSDLRGAVEDMTRVTDDLRSLVMRIRMMPVDAVFMRFPRMVRDLAKRLGKRVELRISGEGTELDRAVIDGLGDALVHMLRNAVDHGLETPEERAAAGKDPVGVIELSARRTGGGVIIEVRDDGRGMDPAALRASAARRGLMSRPAADALSDREAIDLAFLPGVSTAARTTDVSGRGVGMDAVRTAIGELNGEVTIRSAPGEGSAFTIRLPPTLATVQALMVRAGVDADGRPQLWAVPLEAIEEIVIVDPAQARRGRPCAVLRDGAVPLVRLRDRLSPAGGGGGDEGDGGPVEVVVVRGGATRLGLVVDGLAGRREVVIRHPPGVLGDVAGVAGATILGDGSVALVVDAAALAPGAGRPGT